MELLNVKNVVKKCGNKIVLDNVSFSLSKGEIMGYLGPNASGKTTTIKSIVGLSQISSGSISLFGYDVGKHYDKVFPRVGVLFDSNGLYERLTAMQNLEFFMKACSNSHGYNKELVLSILKEFKLDEVKYDKVKTFSKGMKRKLALARLLLIQPDILILDEPFDGIDMENRNTIITLINKYQTNYQMSVIITSHVMADIEELATKVVVLKQGKILADMPIDQFRDLSQDTKVKVVFANKGDKDLFVELCNKKQPNILSIIQNGYTVTVSYSNNENINIKKMLIENKIDFQEIYNMQENIGDIYLRMVK